MKSKNTYTDKIKNNRDRNKIMSAIKKIENHMEQDSPFLSGTLTENMDWLLEDLNDVLNYWEDN